MPYESITQVTAEELTALYRATEARAARMRLLVGVGRDLAIASGIAEASEIVLHRAAEFSTYDQGCLVFVDEDGSSISVVAKRGPRFTNLDSQFGLLADVPAHAACVSAVFASSPGLKDLLDRSGMSISFGSAVGHASGALLLATEGVPPLVDADDQDTLGLLVSNLAAMAMIARQRDAQSRLNALLEVREASLADLVGRLISIQEEERQRLAIDLHDGLAQITCSAHQHLQAFADTYVQRDFAAADLLNRGLHLIRLATAETRAIIAGLRPVVLDDFGIATAIEEELDELRANAIEATFHNGTTRLRLAPDVETTLFRVVQESLRNVRKHAAATRVEVSLQCDADTLWLRIRDNGCGFTASVQPTHRRRGDHLGMLGMQERMRQIGGSCRIDSTPMLGVVVEARVALPVANDDNAYATHA